MSFIICRQWRGSLKMMLVVYGRRARHTQDAVRALRPAHRVKLKSEVQNLLFIQKFHKLVLKPFGNLKSDKWEYLYQIRG